MTESLSSADAEKQRAARSSLMWAALLTIIKLSAGLATNSLGILSEALHSGLDLVAAGITMFAVRLASRPADKAHPYGYGKAENLAALAETGLLLLTCGWIFYEAIERLFFSSVQVQPTLWGAGVIVVSLVVDITRSRMLRRVAKKHNSQALEADALHFSTDVWSSLVVLVGLTGLWLSSFFPEGSLAAKVLHMGDAVAALFVAGLVIWVSMQLAARSIGALMDAGNAARAEEVERALADKLPGCVVQRLRVRQVGSLNFVDMTVETQSDLSVETAHNLTRQIEEVVQSVLMLADVTVHVEPREEQGTDILQRAHALAAGHALAVHKLTLSSMDGTMLLSLHVEVPPELTLSEAHRRVAAFEHELAKYATATVVTHIEPREQKEHCSCTPMTAEEEAKIRASVDAVSGQFPEIQDVHDICIYQGSQAPLLSMHCGLAGDMPVQAAHELASQLERQLHEACPTLSQIVIHTDPIDTGEEACKS